MYGTHDIYLDHNATTPLLPEVVEAMVPYLVDQFGNPSSAHRYGRAVRAKISEARELVGAAIGAKPSEIIFTSGGTEADHLAVIGFMRTMPTNNCHMVTSSIEHPAILAACNSLSDDDYSTTVVAPDSQGVVHPESVTTALRQDTALLTLMHANNEVGTIQPIADIFALAHEQGVTTHTDAAQSFMKIPVDVDRLHVDLLTIAAHKINGPKGTGALYIRQGIKLQPLIRGGHQERDIRAGTENVAGIIGLAKAVEVGQRTMGRRAEALMELRDELQRRIVAAISESRINGGGAERLPGTLNVSFAGADGEALMINLDMEGIAVSTGSACGSGARAASPVLQAMQVPPEYIDGSIRISFGIGNSMTDVETVAELLPEIVQRVRDAGLL